MKKQKFTTVVVCSKMEAKKFGCLIGKNGIRKIAAVFDSISFEIRRIITSNHYNAYEIKRITEVFD